MSVVVRACAACIKVVRRIFSLIIYGLLIFSVMLAALPVAMVVIGYVYLNDCPVEPLIPIYLLVGGSVGLLESLLMCIDAARDGEGGQEPLSCLSWTRLLITIFLYVWFFLGNLLVYSKERVWSVDSGSPNYCHPVLYYLAFWQITTFVLILVAFVSSKALSSSSDRTVYHEYERTWYDEYV